MQFSIKVHRHPDDVITAVCDAEILGKTFRGDGLRIEVSNGFYGGDVVSEEEVRNALRTCSVANIVGNNVVDIALDMGLISPENVITIGGVRHAQAVRM